MVALFLSGIVTLALPHIPGMKLLVWPLVLLSTLAHELGHGVTALVVGGDFERFELFANGSGVAFTRAPGALGSALVAAGGLVGPAVTAMLLFVMARTERWSRVGLGLLAASLGVALVFVVRNLFGFAFVGVLLGLLAVIVRYGNARWARFSLVFLAVNLAVSVFTRGDYLFRAVARTGHGDMPSDVAIMASALWLPYWFWGAVCTLVSVSVLALGMRLYLRGSHPATD